jgi:hypothetical protein
MYGDSGCIHHCCRGWQELYSGKKVGANDMEKDRGEVEQKVTHGTSAIMAAIDLLEVAALLAFALFKNGKITPLELRLFFRLVWPAWRFLQQVKNLPRELSDLDQLEIALIMARLSEAAKALKF